MLVTCAFLSADGRRPWEPRPPSSGTPNWPGRYAKGCTGAYGTDVEVTGGKAERTVDYGRRNVTVAKSHVRSGVALLGTPRSGSILSLAGAGVGLWKVDAFAEVLFMTSQVVHATLFIASAKGYTPVPAKDCQLEFTRLSFAASLGAQVVHVCFWKSAGRNVFTQAS